MLFQTDWGEAVRTDDLWPGRPKLLPDESFASWFTRIAAANGLRPIEMLRILQPGGDRNPRDLDRFADAHLLHRLAEKTRVEGDGLEWTTFARWAGMVFERDDGLNKLAWLPPAGRQGGRRCYGQQVCPLCLSGDQQPYFRLTWRLSFVTVCPTHNCLLLDRCPSCGEPFNALRQEDRRSPLCWGCGTDIRQFAGEPPPFDAVPIQRALLGLAAQGWAGMGEYGPVYSFAALHILALLTRFLAGGPHAHALRQWVGAQNDQFALPAQTIPRAREGALLNARARCLLVGMGHWLLGEWPHRFVAAARAVGMTSTDLRKQTVDQYPFAYAHVVDWHLKEPFKGSAKDEVAAAKEILKSRGLAPTYRNLVELAGARRMDLSELGEPLVETAPWGKGRYWKLDGVSPEVKSAARLAAHRSGEGVGPWLDGMLRRELGLPARKSPYARQSPDTFAPDHISGCE